MRKSFEVDQLLTVTKKDLKLPGLKSCDLANLVNPLDRIRRTLSIFLDVVELGEFRMRYAFSLELLRAYFIS